MASTRAHPAQPGPGQESVWEYPRPPRVERSDRRVRIAVAGRTVVDTTDAVRVLETSHPPGWYVPLAAVRGATLRREPLRTTCEFKGRAVYWSLVVGDVVAERAAWGYPSPTRGFELLADRFTVYPARVDACWLDDERVQAQEGDFYGGWITADVVGPFKGGAGTLGW